MAANCKQVKRELDEMLGYMIGALSRQPSEDELIKFIKRSKNIEHDFYVSHAVKKWLGTRFILNIYEKQDTLPMVLTAHLMLEAFINRIIKYKFPRSEAILKPRGRRFGFAQKVHILWADGCFDKDLYRNILTINGLRNEYAHNLFYDIADYNLARLHFYRGYFDKIPMASNKAKRHLKTFAIRMAFYYILSRLTCEYPIIAEVEC